MAIRVRIIRKRKSVAHQLMAWGNLFTLLAKFAARPQIEANLNYLQELRAEEIKMRTRVAAMREAKLANELVIQDMRIELMKKQLESEGKPFAPPSDYNS